MKWNSEWIDLQNIERRISDCWRMNDRQLEECCEDLSRRQELVFAGALGLKFLELLRRHVNGSEKLDWSKLQKDVTRMQALIQDGYERDEDYWKQQYEKLMAGPSVFYTNLGAAFIKQIAAKLELDISEDRRRLRHDVEKIEKICETYNWKNEAEIRKAVSFLSQKAQTDFFSSWLGKGFLDILLERFEPKEEKPAPEIKQQAQEAAVETETAETETKNGSWKMKIAVVLIICIFALLFGFWIYTQVQERQGRAGLGIFGTGISDESDGNRQSSRADAADDSQGGQADASGGSHTGQNDSADGSQTLDQNGNQETVLEDSQSDMPDSGTASTGSEQKPAVMPDVLARYQSFYEKYPDVFGWLKIPGTEIDHPVMQSDDEKKGEQYYYLHRDYTGRKSEAGSLFVESRSSCYPQDDNTVIYGHNMSNGHNFGLLERYKDKDFFKEHQTIQYDTIYETGTYQIAAVLITRVLYQDEPGFRYYQFYDYNTEEEFKECTDFIEKNQLYDTGVKLEYGSRLLMLSTCEYSRENGRLVIVAKRTA